MSGFPEAKSGAVCVRNDLKKPYVPRVWGYFVDSLTCEGKADQFGLEIHATTSEERKNAVKVTTAHADAIIVGIESDHWC